MANRSQHSSIAFELKWQCTKEYSTKTYQITLADLDFHTLDVSSMLPPDEQSSHSLKQSSGTFLAKQ